MLIIPGQRKMVDGDAAGGSPTRSTACAAKQRSVHNNYFTLPVLFIMISNHYAMTYGHQHAWAVLAVIMAAGVLIRHFFNLRHKGRVEWKLSGRRRGAAAGAGGRDRAEGAGGSAGRDAAAQFAQVQTIIDAALRVLPFGPARPSPALPPRRPASCCTTRR